MASGPSISAGLKKDKLGTWGICPITAPSQLNLKPSSKLEKPNANESYESLTNLDTWSARLLWSTLSAAAPQYDYIELPSLKVVLELCQTHCKLRTIYFLIPAAYHLSSAKKIRYIHLKLIKFSCALYIGLKSILHHQDSALGYCGRQVLPRPLLTLSRHRSLPDARGTTIEVMRGRIFRSNGNTIHPRS